ncbi:Gp19/Gp15/Gp42 family protein [Nocardia gipuzkoensis]
MAFATADEVEDGWRTLSQAEKDRAAVLLDDAAWWLKVWFLDYGDIEALAANNAMLAEGLKILSRSMVRRAMTSGAIEGAQSTYQVMGPFSTQVAFKNPDGNLYITNSEHDGILAVLGVNTSGAVSMTGPGL